RLSPRTEATTNNWPRRSLSSKRFSKSTTTPSRNTSRLFERRKRRKLLNGFEAFEAKVRFDERDASQNSLRKNNYHRGLWAREALEVEEVATRFADFLRRHATVAMLAGDGRPYQLAQLVAHNAPFDGAFLQAWYERRFLPARYQVFCTLQRALWYFTN